VKGGPNELAVNRVENEGQHDRTPLFDPRRTKALVRFRMTSSNQENGFVSR